MVPIAGELKYIYNGDEKQASEAACTKPPARFWMYFMTSCVLKVMHACTHALPQLLVGCCSWTVVASGL